jgi:hypothetical protein
MGSGASIIGMVMDNARNRRSVQQDRLAADFLRQFETDPNAAIPAGLDDPSVVGKLQEMAKTRRDQGSVEEAMRRLSVFAQPNMVPSRVAGVGQLDTPTEMRGDMLAFAQSEGMDPKAYLPAVSALEKFARDPNKIENFGGTPYVADAEAGRVDLAPGFVAPEKPRRTAKERVLKGGTERDVLLDLDTGEEIRELGKGERWKPGEGEGGGGGKGTPTAKDLMDDIRAVQSRIAGFEAGENITSEALGSKIPEATKRMQGELVKTQRLLIRNFPEVARKAGYYTTPDEVKAAVQSGAMTQDQGTQYLVDVFDFER